MWEELVVILSVLACKVFGLVSILIDQTQTQTPGRAKCRCGACRVCLLWWVQQPPAQDLNIHGLRQRSPMKPPERMCYV